MLSLPFGLFKKYNEQTKKTILLANIEYEYWFPWDSI